MHGYKAAAAKYIPLFGTAAFAGLIAMALIKFPGGNRFHPEAEGFSFLENFWCDLFDPESYGHVPNGGRSYAICGTILLFLSFTPMWWTVPQNFRRSPWLRRPTQVCGIAAMIMGGAVPTSWHDDAILLAGPFGAAAYFFMLVGLARNGRPMLAGLGVVPLGLAVLNFSLWFGQTAIAAIPALQKLAFLTFIAWILALSSVPREGTP